jgi:hypothetical protein
LDRHLRNLTAALRGWPVREIEHGVRLSVPQRVALYELVTSSLKAAAALGRRVPRRDRAHPAGPHEDDAGTPRGRAAGDGHNPPGPLDQVQKVRFAGMR